MAVESTTLLVWVTGALALVTTVMAYATFRTAKAAEGEIEQGRQILTAAQEQADAAHTQSEISAAAFDASVMPMLVGLVEREVPLASGATRQIRFPDGQIAALDGSGVYIAKLGLAVVCAISMRNVGSGTAVIRGLGLRFGSTVWGGAMSSAVVPPGETTIFTFALPDDRKDVTNEDRHQLLEANASLEVGYTDAYGRQPYRAVAHLYGPRTDTGTMRRRVRQVALYRGQEQEPFVMSGPSGD